MLDESCIERGPAYAHVRNGHRGCVVVFSSFAERDYGEKAFSFNKQFSSIADRQDLIFIKDTKNQWYNRDLPGIGSGVDQISSWISSRVAEYDSVVFFGASMGGYASLVFGSRVPGSHVIAVAPQVFLRFGYPRYRTGYHSGYYVNLEGVHLNLPGRIDVIVGEEDLFDVFQLNLVNPGRNVIRWSVPNAYHNVLFSWNRVGLFDRLVAAIGDGTQAQLLDGWRSGNRKRSVVAARANDPDFNNQLRLFIEARQRKQHQRALDALARIMPESVPWLGADAAKGLLLLAAGEADAGIDLLLDVDRRNSAIDDFYRPLAHALALKGRMAEAKRVVGRGVLFAQGNRRIYREIEEIRVAAESAAAAAAIAAQ